MSDTAIIALAGVITTIAGFIFQAWQITQKIRQSAQELKDGQLTQATVVQANLQSAAATVESRLVTAASQLKSDTTTDLNNQTDTIKLAIENAKLHTTNAAQEAYHEANTVNVKLEKLHLENERLGRVLAELVGKITAVVPVITAAADPRVDSIKATGEDTNRIVRGDTTPVTPL